MTQKTNQWQITDDELLDSRLKQIDNNPDFNVLLNVLRKLSLTNHRILPRISEKDILNLGALQNRFPHFYRHIEWLRNHLRLSHACKFHSNFPPALLIGPPGVGKSFYLGELARCLNYQLIRINLPDVTANFVLTGNSSSWQNGQPGLIAKAISGNPMPFIVFDELDKCGNDPGHRYNVAPTLLSMLEPATAGQFMDESLELALNLHPVPFAFTANTLQGLDPALRSRLSIFPIDMPYPQEMASIVVSVDETLRRDDLRFNHLFKPLSVDCLTLFGVTTPRLVRRILEMAYGQAATRYKGSRLALRPEDLLPLLQQQAVAESSSEALTKPTIH